MRDEELQSAKLAREFYKKNCKSTGCDYRSGRALLPTADERVDATRRYLEYVIMPLWSGSGVADYIFHRRSKIETSSGVTESLIHCLMMVEGGIPTVAGLFLDVNAGMLKWSLLAFAAHQATMFWDVAYAVKRRLVTPNEQHVHSALEMLPFCALSFLLCLHWDQARALLGSGDAPAVTQLKWKNPPLPSAYSKSMLVVTGVLAGLYSEELWRCIAGRRKGLIGKDSPAAARELFGEDHREAASPIKQFASQRANHPIEEPKHEDQTKETR